MNEVLVCTRCGLAYEEAGYKRCPRCKGPLIKAEKVGKNRLIVKKRDT
jgi:uncharacterized protein YbaR (Trm112 family)